MDTITIPDTTSVVGVDEQTKTIEDDKWRGYCSALYSLCGSMKRSLFNVSRLWISAHLGSLWGTGWDRTETSNTVGEVGRVVDR